MNRGDVLKRQQVLEEGFKKRHEDHPDSDVIFPGIAFYLLHSISHLLIHTFALECGYSASSLRERIYVPAPDGSAAHRQTVGETFLCFICCFLGTLVASSVSTLREPLERSVCASGFALSKCLLFVSPISPAKSKSAPTVIY